MQWVEERSKSLERSVIWNKTHESERLLLLQSCFMSASFRFVVPVSLCLIWPAQSSTGLDDRKERELRSLVTFFCR